MSWYRTYRPQTIASLHLDSVRETLDGIRKSGVVHHALLFAGPKGTGKTSSARIFAKMLNCEKNKNHKEKQPFHEPCNTCAFCTHITEGNNLSVIEMDAASNRGIDDIRALRDNLNLAPSEGKYTVYIIDEVHMLTTEAFNALLKVLEEPPKHVVFILATTEQHKIPETILSRCVLVPFKKATLKELESSLQTIAKQENITVSKEVLTKIATYARGSFRDGVKVFEQCAQGTQELDEKHVESILSSGVFSYVERCIEGVFAKDAHIIVELFKELDTKDVDIAHFQSLLLEELHARMLEVLDTPKEAQKYAYVLKHFSVPLSSVLPIVYLPLELECLRICLSGKEEGEKTSTDGGGGKLQAKPVVVHKEESPKEVLETVRIPMPIHEIQNIEPVTQESMIAVEELESLWMKVLNAISPQNASLGALLKAAYPQSIQGNTVTLAVHYAFHKDQLSQEKYRKIIEQIIGEMCGMSNMRLAFVLGDTQHALQHKADTATPTLAEKELVSVAEEAFL